MKANLLFLSILLVCAAVSAQTTQKLTSNTPGVAPQSVKIQYDEPRQFFYIADSATGTLIKALPYKKVNQFTEGMALVETDRGVGFINGKGTEIVPPSGKYKWANDFSGGMAVVGINDDKGEIKAAGFINKSGALAIPMNFQNASSFKEKLAAAKKNGKWGFINKTGVFVIPAMYEEAHDFSRGLAAVSKNKTADGYTLTYYGYIDKTGKQILPFVYDKAGNFRSISPEHEGALVWRGFVPYLIDKKGIEEGTFTGLDKELIVTDLNWISEDKSDILVEARERYSGIKYGVYGYFATIFMVKPEYSEIQLSKEPYTGMEYYFVKKGNRIGLFDRYSSQIPAVYDHIQFNDSLVYAISDIKTENNQVKSGTFSLYDLNLKLLTKNKYEFITGFSDGLAKVKRDGKIGFINKNGEEIIPTAYEDAGDFSSGLVSILKNKKVGVINKKGEVIVPAEFEDIGTFNDGFTYYQQNGTKGIIDQNGKKITDAIFQNMGNYSHGVAQYSKDNKVGYINTKGEVAIPATFDSGNPFSDGLAMVKTNNLAGFIDLQGKQAIACKYDDASDFINGCAMVQENGKVYLIDKKGTILKTY